MKKTLKKAIENGLIDKESIFWHHLQRKFYPFSHFRRREDKPYKHTDHMFTPYSRKITRNVFIYITESKPESPWLCECIVCHGQKELIEETTTSTIRPERVMNQFKTLCPEEIEEILHTRTTFFLSITQQSCNRIWERRKNSFFFWNKQTNPWWM